MGDQAVSAFRTIADIGPRSDLPVKWGCGRLPSIPFLQFVEPLGHCALLSRIHMDDAGFEGVSGTLAERFAGLRVIVPHRAALAVAPTRCLNLDC